LYPRRYSISSLVCIIVPTFVEVAEIIIIAEFEFSPNKACSFPAVVEFFFYILFVIKLKAFSKLIKASYSLLIIFIRKLP